MTTNQSAWNPETSTAAGNGSTETGRDRIVFGSRRANMLILDNSVYAIGSVGRIDEWARFRIGSDRSDRLRTGSSCWRCCAPVRVVARRSTSSSSTSRSSTSSPVSFSYSPSSPTRSRRRRRPAAGSSASCSRPTPSWPSSRTAPSPAWS